MTDLEFFKYGGVRVTRKLDTAEYLVPGIEFPWPMEEGHNSFVIETKPPFSYYCDSSKEWRFGINIGVFSAPTMDDIQHWKRGTRRRAIVDVYKFRVSKRGKRTGQILLSREVLFDKKDRRPPSELTAILISQTELPRQNWK